MRAFKTPTLLWLLLAVVAEHGRGQLLELPSLQPLANNFATAQRNSNANNAHPPNANEGKDAPPCTSTRYAANPLVLPESLCSFMGNRPPGERCKLPLRVTLPETCRDPSLLRSAPVVILISGFGVKAQAYNTLVGDLSRWGYVVIQYERDLPNVAPPNDVENQYIEHLFSWLDDQRENATAPLYGRLSQNVTIAGHSMGGGLASMAAGSHRHRVDTAILFDPVDFSFLDDHVSKVYLKKFGKPVLIFTVGVRCMDRTGCLPPTSSAELTMKEPARPCAPSWWCCDWDSRTAAPMTSMGPWNGAEHPARRPKFFCARGARRIMGGHHQRCGSHVLH
eukprot:jgi/Botrbrau1/19390/Bobra.0338s0020.1